MDFNLTEERQMLSNTLTRYLAECYQSEHRNSIAYKAPFHDPCKWKEMAKLGIFSALVNEADGGFGGAGTSGVGAAPPSIPNRSRLVINFGLDTTFL